MARIKAFTLVEFFTIAAVVAIVGAVLSPITAAAKQSGKSTNTASTLRVVGLAAIAYASDYDQQTVLSQATTTRLWPVLLTPYVASRDSFFDPTRPIPTGVNVPVGTVSLPWYMANTIGINESGYTGRWETVGNTCGGRKSRFVSGGHSLDAMTEPYKRVAFAPTTYGATTAGWSIFHSYDASVINTATLLTTFSYNNMVWNTNTIYARNLIPVVHADGSAGALSRADFKTTTEVPTQAALCAWLSTEGQRTWGPFWRND